MLLERAPELRHALAGARRDELHRWPPALAGGVQQTQRGGEVAAGALGAWAVLVGLVDRHQVGDLEDAALDALQLVAGARDEQHEEGVDHAGDRHLALPDADGLDEHHVVAGGLEHQHRLAGAAGDAAERAAGRGRAHEGAFVLRQLASSASCRRGCCRRCARWRGRRRARRRGGRARAASSRGARSACSCRRRAGRRRRCAARRRWRGRGAPAAPAPAPGARAASSRRESARGRPRCGRRRARPLRGRRGRACPRVRHCEGPQGPRQSRHRDCFVAALLAMTGGSVIAPAQPQPSCRAATRRRRG